LHFTRITIRSGSWEQGDVEIARKESTAINDPLVLRTSSAAVSYKVRASRRKRTSTTQFVASAYRARGVDASISMIGPDTLVTVAQVI
jgi:hypothetical protein